MIEPAALEPMMGRPHVVILGAGASRAAFLHGDANGRPLPLMRDLVDIPEIESLFRQAGIDPRGEDFEALYSTLASNGGHASLTKQIEDRVFEYFSSLRLPDEPTLYDHLVLSLRGKDLIATFNWDPLLWDAWNRNYRSPAHAPHLAHLHGNVVIGHCARHELVQTGRRGRACPRCGEPLAPSRLLYPTYKDYASDPGIYASWEGVTSCLGQAYRLTIFGYSSPASDVEAMRLLRDAWGNPHDPCRREVELINTCDEHKLRETWGRFLDGPHFSIVRDFSESKVKQFPRRSCEAEFHRTMNCAFLKPQPFPSNAGWEDLQAHANKLMEQEVMHDERENEMTRTRDVAEDGIRQTLTHAGSPM